MNTSSNGLVAVFGATGKQGGAVVDALLGQGASVRALVRDPDAERSRRLAARGVELVRADTDDPASLVPALAGVDSVFFMTTMAGPDGIEGETRQGIALADAAVKAGVAHVVYSSVGGAERHTGIPHFESKRRVEEHLEDLNVRVTILRPVFFTDNLAGTAAENGEIVIRFPFPDGIPLQMVAVHDIGVAAAAALLGTAEIPGDRIELGGAELTGSEIAAAFAERAGLPARYEALPLSVLAGQPDAEAMFRWFAELPAYQADFAGTRAIVPNVLDLPTWLEATNWTA